MANTLEPRFKKHDKLGPYEIQRLIGQGGMGEVYLARDIELDRPVALKIINRTMAGDGEVQRRFSQEGKTLARLRHPCLVTVFGVGEEDGVAFMAMEYVEGLSLASYLEHGTFGIGEALHLTIQIVEGIAAAHKSGVIHRDLKPVNIIVDEDHRVKIIDFGIARVLDVIPLEQTAVGTILGTVHYMAPEVARGQALSIQTDIYAIGVILYEMLIGQRPFEGASSLEILERIKAEPVRFPSTIVALIPEPIQSIILKLTAKDPRERFQSASEILTAIRALKLNDWPADLTTVWPRCDIENEQEIHAQLEKLGFSKSEFSLILHLAWQIQSREEKFNDKTERVGKSTAEISMRALEEGVARYRQAKIQATDSQKLSPRKPTRHLFFVTSAVALLVTMSIVIHGQFKSVTTPPPSLPDRALAQVSKGIIAPKAPEPASNARTPFSESNPDLQVKVFKGPEGEWFTVLLLQPPGEYQRALIKFHGVGGPFEDKLLAHTLRTYDGKQDYRLDGENYVSITKRFGKYEAYPKGAHGPIPIIYDEAESNRLLPSALAREFNESLH